MTIADPDYAKKLLALTPAEAEARAEHQGISLRFAVFLGCFFSSFACADHETTQQPFEDKADWTSFDAAMAGAADDRRCQRQHPGAKSYFVCVLGLARSTALAAMTFLDCAEPEESPDMTEEQPAKEGKKNVVSELAERV
jgi:hypothetical protein